MRLKKSTRTISYTKPADFSVPLAQLCKIDPSLDKKQSRFLPVHRNDEALTWRLTLIEQAITSIDAQYYSWHADTSGRLLLKKLIEAADRGVRVRLLLDDIHTFGADRQIAILNQHKNIEVRLFNPFSRRSSIKLFRIIELLWNLKRLNHRMHNKLIIADNVFSLLGGRNIGDEYFGLNNKYVFRDLDILVCGPSVDYFSKSFDIYWNSGVSKTARRIIAFRPRRVDFRQMNKRLSHYISMNISIINRIQDLQSTLINKPDFAESLTTSEPHVFYDLPERGENEQSQMAQKLHQCSLGTTRQMTVISAYFVPSEKLMSTIVDMVNRGVKIQVFTNSLESIDVTAAFSGYARYRRQLLSIGVELFEFRADPESHSIFSTPYINVERFGLHAKSIIYDSSSVYVGTLNLDPRSATLNTEIGVLIDNPLLCENIRSAFLKDLSDGQFWKVTLNNSGRVCWTCGKDSTTLQPARNLWQRVANFIYCRLPIQQHL